MYRSPIRNLNFGTVPDESVDEQGMFGDFVDSVQRGFYQGMAGTFETADQLTGFGGGVRDWLNTQADKQISEMSESGQNALTQEIFTEDENGNLTLGEGATNAATWLNYLGQGIGTVGSFIGTGGAGGAVAKGGIKLLASAAGRKALESAAKKEAAKMGFKGKAKDFVANAAISVTVGNGMIANGEREKYQNLSFSELKNSQAFSDIYWKLREDPENQYLSNEELGQKAREVLAEEAADRAFYDPKITAANLLSGAAGAVGGRGLGITGNILELGKTAKAGLLKGAFVEGAQESVQGGVETLVSNEIYRDLVDPNKDVMEGVVSGALNEGVIGGAIGGGFGTVEGYKQSRKSDLAEDVQPESLPDQEVEETAEAVDERTPEQRAVEEPITGNTPLDTQYNRMEDTSSAHQELLNDIKSRKAANEEMAQEFANTELPFEQGDLLDTANSANTASPNEVSALSEIDESHNGALQHSDPEVQRSELYKEGLVRAMDISPAAVTEIAELRKSGQISESRAIHALQNIINSVDKKSPDERPIDSYEKALFDEAARERNAQQYWYEQGQGAHQPNIENSLEFQRHQHRLKQGRREQSFTSSSQREAYPNGERDITPINTGIEDQLVSDAQRLSHRKLPNDYVGSWAEIHQKSTEEDRQISELFKRTNTTTKGISKNLRRRIQRAKGFDTNAVLSEFQNHEKRLQAYQADAKRQAVIEAAKPENVARRRSAEMLFAEKIGSDEAINFRDNLVTEAMNKIHAAIDHSAGSVLEMDGKEVSLPQVKNQLSNSARHLANKFISKSASVNETLRVNKRQSEVSNEPVSDVQPDPESVQEEPSQQPVSQSEQQSENSGELESVKQSPIEEQASETVAAKEEAPVSKEQASEFQESTRKEPEQGDSLQEIKQETDDNGNVSLYSLEANQTNEMPTEPTKQQVEQFVEDIFKGSPDIAHAETLVEVVSSEQELPNHIQYQILNDDVEGKVNGVYDPHSQKVYLVAPKVPTKEHAERFIFHELVGHHGLRSLFGEDINKELASIRTMLGGKSGILKLARKMGVDLSQYVEMTNGAISNNQISASQADYILFDELLAHVAENNKAQSAIDRLVQKVKNWLRRHGFKTLASYGKSDLMELLTNIRTSLNNPPPTNPPGGKKGRVSYSLAKTDSVDQILNAKQTNLVKRIKSAIKGSTPMEALGRYRYAMLTLRQMGEVAGFKDKQLGQMIDGYQQEINSMVSTQNSLAEEAATISDDLSNWAKKNRKEADQLFSFAHDATLADVDPSLRAFKSRAEELKQEIEKLERAYQKYGGSSNERGIAIFKELKELREILKQEPNRREEYLRLKPIWHRLSKEQQAKFREMRDYYIKQGERFDKSLEENIKRAVEDQKIRKEMLAKLRQRQEVRAKGLYFPLSRFGDYWLDFADENGERQYVMFESKAEMEDKRDRLRDAGVEVKSGMRAQGNEGQQVSLPFVADVMNLIRSSKMNQHNADTLSDQVYQMYLRTLPGRSLRRHFIHRKGVEGFSNDAIRVLADNGFKQSRQQARLDHMDVLDNHLVNIKKYTEMSPDNAEISQITEELDKRHEWVRNPHRSAWAQKLTSLGFTWLLGLTPAAALVNLTQNLQVAIPVLGSKHGFAKTSAMMARTSKEFMRDASKALRGADRKRGYGVMGNYLKGQELEAFREAVKQGVIDTTQAADLAGLAENPNAKYSGTWNKAMNIVGWAFHNAEVFNREVTFMTAYRLAKEKHGDHQKAIDEAIKDTWESHFDYSSTNRARFMQSDMAAVAFQFKQYSQNMTYYLWSNLAKSLKGETPEVKAQARKQLLSTFAMTFGIGGLGALPMWMIALPIDAAQAAFGDDDEPWSAEVELKSMLSEAVGKENAALLWYGSLPSISGRISLNDLWVRSIDRDIDADKKYLEYLKQALGPVIGGIGFSFAQGLGDIGDDFGIRSAEKMSPKVVKDMLKMARYINEEGVFTRTGAQVIGDMSPGELVGQALGFSSGRANIQYDENNAIKNYEMHLSKRRSQLVNGYYTAHRLGDKQAMNELLEKIQKWNRSKYGRMNPITSKSLQRSIKSRINNLNKTNSGLRISDKYRSLITEYDFF